jgi:hypothetical protein
MMAEPGALPKHVIDRAARHYRNHATDEEIAADLGVAVWRIRSQMPRIATRARFLDNVKALGERPCPDTTRSCPQ